MQILPLEGKQGYDTYARNTLDKIHHDKKKKLNKLKIKRPEPSTRRIQSISARLHFVSKVIVLIGEKQVPKLSY